MKSRKITIVWHPKNYLLDSFIFTTAKAEFIFGRAKTSKLLNSDLKIYCHDQKFDLIETMTYTK